MMEEYQIFISYKNLDPQGKRTRDSVLAEEIFEYLSKKGLKVFFGDISIGKAGVSLFSKVIEQALDSCRVLIAVGTSVNNLTSGRVKFEWESFFYDIID